MNINITTNIIINIIITIIIVIISSSICVVIMIIKNSPDKALFQDAQKSNCCNRTGSKRDRCNRLSLRARLPLGF